MGIGIDIVEIQRIAVILSRRGDKFAKKILTKNEWILFKQFKQYHHSVNFLAKRFAAKEAASKAMGLGIRNGLTFNQFEINNDICGKPFLSLFNNAAKLAEKLHIDNIHLSLSDERYYAFATVIFESA